jgi:hypothetical protein
VRDVKHARAMHSNCLGAVEWRVGDESRSEIDREEQWREMARLCDMHL